MSGKTDSFLSTAAWRDKIGALVHFPNRDSFFDVERRLCGRMGVIVGLCDNPFYARVLVDGCIENVYECALEEVGDDQR
jgi:hypothetical protein